jgi:hypothetical protein
MDPDVIFALIPIVALVMVAVMAIGIPIARAHARRMDSRPGIPADLSHRLQRMEQSLEAIAVEVERITEGQRFTTKLLAERGGAPAQAKAPAEVERAGVPPGEQRS